MPNKITILSLAIQSSRVFTNGDNELKLIGTHIVIRNSTTQLSKIKAIQLFHNLIYTKRDSNMLSTLCFSITTF